MLKTRRWMAAVFGLWLGIQPTLFGLWAQGEVAFIARWDFLVGGSLRSLVVEDFNGDQILDVAVAGLDPTSVSLLRGLGDGTFPAARHVPVGDDCCNEITSGDFNGDRIPDLAVSHLVAHRVSVLIGWGNGTFQVGEPMTVGNGPLALVAGDLNGDSFVDLAVTNWGFPIASNAVSLLWGAGDGTFQVASRLTVGLRPAGILLADFNGDALPDLAVANSADGRVSILLGQGEGRFEAVGPLLVGVGPRGLAVGDFNDDKVLDLAVANNGSDTVSIGLGRGDGTFQAAPAMAVARGAVGGGGRRFRRGYGNGFSRGQRDGRCGVGPAGGRRRDVSDGPGDAGGL